MNNITDLTLAEFILAAYPTKGITPMKLQKLAYYAKVWTLVAGENFVNAQFKKWDYGPVNYPIYQKYKSYGKNVITNLPSVSSLCVDEEKAELLKFILNNYVNHSALALSAITHKEEPWVQTPTNGIISDEAIFKYYSKQPFAKNFHKKISGNDPFHVLQNDSWHAFTLDMEPGEAVAFQVYASYDEFQKNSQKAEIEFADLIKLL